jgi:hypothetical protein
MGTIQPHIGPPTVTPAKLRLYDRFHVFQTERLGWPTITQDADGYLESFVNNLAFTQEWCYYSRAGSSALATLTVARRSKRYFTFYDPLPRPRLGVFNVLCLLERAWELAPMSTWATTSPAAGRWSTRPTIGPTKYWLLTGRAIS